MELVRRPSLQIGNMRTQLFAYRISDSGIFFVEATEKNESSDQVNFITSGIILNAAGKEYRDHEIGRLLAQNAIDSVWSADLAKV